MPFAPYNNITQHTTFEWYLAVAVIVTKTNAQKWVRLHPSNGIIFSGLNPKVLSVLNTDKTFSKLNLAKTELRDCVSPTQYLPTSHKTI
jgi:hypothetical protein